ncbi:MAG: hypothetical protein Q9174_001110 [Haloplaca sp. 1 TL-2023]
MSKSHTDSRSRILLNDSANAIRSKVKGALTDSIEGLTYDPIRRPGVSNLLSLMAAMDKQKRSEEQLVADCQALSMRAFKDAVSDAITSGLADIKDKYDYFTDSAQSQLLREIIVSGNAKAQSKAEDTMICVRRLVGVEKVE